MKRNQSTPTVYRGLLTYYLTISALISLPIWMLLLLPQILLEQGWSPVEVGWIIGVYFAIHLAVQIGAGQISSRIGNVGTATLGSLIGVAGGLLYILALVYPYLFFSARVLHGAGAALVFAGALFLLVQSVPVHLKGRMMGYFGLPGFVMLAVGPLLAAYLIETLGSGLMLASVPACFLIVLLLLRRLPQPLDPEQRVRPPFMLVLRTNLPRLKGILGISFVFGLSFAVWQTFLASTAGQRIGAAAVSWFGVGYGSGAILSRLGLAQRFDQGNRRLIAIASLALYAVSLSLIPHGFRVWHLFVLGLACGLAHGTFYPGLSSLASERFHPLHTGPAMSLYISASTLGLFVGPPLWGSLVELVGYSILFGLAGLTLFSATSYFLMREWRKIDRSRSWAPLEDPETTDSIRKTSSGKDTEGLPETKSSG